MTRLLGLLPAAARLGPLEQMVDRAEVVGDPGLAAVSDQEHVHLSELGAAVRAGERSPLDRGGLVELSRLPVRALDRPGDHVLEPAEDRPAIAGGLEEPEAIVGFDDGSAPCAGLGHTAGICSSAMATIRIVALEGLLS